MCLRFRTPNLARRVILTYRCKQSSTVSSLKFFADNYMLFLHFRCYKVRFHNIKLQSTIQRTVRASVTSFYHRMISSGRTNRSIHIEAMDPWQGNASN
uniref:Uncharacterized protein n=2 Tax=Anopheles atroparvus TaxID=41427 RepID=A0AAG5DRR0_ANOAO